MPYSIIQPPFTLKFAEMSRAELKAYYAWFMEQIPIRLAILESSVRETPGFGSWAADSTEASLAGLGEWYAMQVETRQRTRDEMEEIMGSLIFPVDVPDHELTNKTFSLAVDIGMYWSTVLRRRYPTLQWDLIMKSKRYVDYGQPVLMGFAAKVPLNPVRIMIVMAYGLADGSKSAARLLELHKVWSAEVV